MRNTALTLANLVVMLIGTLCLFLSVLAVLWLAALLVHSGGALVAPDTGFLVGMLGHFPIGAALLLITAIRRPRSRDWGISLLVMAAVYAFLTIIYAGLGSEEPFYGFIPTVGWMLWLVRLMVFGLVVAAILSLVRTLDSE